MAKKEAGKPAANEQPGVDKDILDEFSRAEPVFLKEIDTGEKYFSDVPSEFRFWLSDGREIKNIHELAQALRTMSQQTFSYHVNRGKNDFSSWAKDIIKDAKLAEKIRNIKDRDEMAATIEARKGEMLQNKKRQEQKATAEKMEIEKAIQKVKEKESMLEKTVAKEKTSTKPPEAKIEKPNRLTSLRKEYAQSETLRKLSSLREMAGLSPILPKQQAKKEDEKKKSKILLKSPKIKESPEMKSLTERERAIHEKEQWISGEEQRINEKRIKLSKMRIELIRQRNELEKENFEQFMKKKGKIEEKIVAELRSRNEIELPDIKQPLPADTSELEGRLSEARALLRQGHNEEARRKIASIKSSLTGMLIPKEEKRMIEYSLMELEADAKLAML